MLFILKNILRLFWRIWFYMLFTGTVLIFSPLLLIVTAREKWYPMFSMIASLWAKTILFCMGFVIDKAILQTPKQDESYIFIANHTSILDVLLMLAVVKNPFVFVGKKELAKMPVFGYFYKKTCILVDRNNIQSKQKVFKAAQKRIDAGLSICIFPEGMVPDDETIVLSEFKKGAFKLAIEHKLTIVPLSFYDCKKRFSYTFFSGSPGRLRVKIHPFIETKDIEISGMNTLQNDCYTLLYNDLSMNE